jgi:undecaprenyl-diphosphatase
VIALVVALVLRRFQPFVLTLLAVVAADVVTTLAKAPFHEARPSEPGPLVTIPNSHSFPSGHAATSFAAATILSAFVPRAAPAFFLLALAIGWSRLYVGVHWPLDVVVGALIGVAIALLLLAAVRRLSTRQRR